MKVYTSETEMLKSVVKDQQEIIADLLAVCEALLADTERGHLYLDPDMTAMLEAAVRKAKGES